MSTLSHINNNTNLASSHLNKNMTSVENAIKRLASGQKFANIGEGVPERSISSSLSSSLSSLKMGKSNAAQALSILNAGHSIMEDSYNILNRQRELAMQAASDTMTDKERVALDIDYQNLIAQIKDNSAFEYNGMKLVDGTYSGETKLNTFQGERLINVFDDISQFSATGTIGENALIQPGSTIEATGNIGKTAASVTVSLGGIGQEGGGVLTINGKNIYILDDPNKFTDPNTQVFLDKSVANYDLVVRDDLVTLLNSSTIPELSQFHYHLTNSTFGDLVVTSNNPGFQGNEYKIHTNLADANPAEYTLKGGTDLRDRATGVVWFDSTTNYSAGDTIEINGEKFTFKDAADVIMPTDVAVGADLKTTMNNLIKSVEKSAGTASQVMMINLDGSHFAIISKEPGLIGNSISFNFGGGSAIYTYDANRGTAANNKSHIATIGGLVSGVDLSDPNSRPHNGTHIQMVTHISTDELTFDQNMQGIFGDKRAIFKPGEIISNNIFTPNKVQFIAYLNGELYQSNDIALAGGNVLNGTANGSGYHGLGNRIAGGTELTFHKVGAKNTDIGFKLRVKDEGVTIHSTNLHDIQKELNAGAQSVTKAMELGNVQLGILGSTYTVEDFGLSSTEQFFASGKMEHDHRLLNSNINVTNTIGDVKAQGTIKLVANPLDGDQVVLNGKTITFGTDVSVGNSIKESRDNLLNYLNGSTDNNLAQAVYHAVDDSDNNDFTVVVKSKTAGNIGNSFTLSTTNTDSVRLNDLKLDTTTLGDNGHSYNETASVGRKASAASITGSNFAGAEEVDLTFTGLGINESIKFIGETSTTATSNTVIQINGATTAEEAAQQIAAGINNYISNHTQTELHQVEFSSLNNQIILRAKDEGASPNDIIMTSSDNALVQSVQLANGTNTLYQTVGSGPNVIPGSDLEQHNLLPITPTLQGSMSNLDATFHEGAVNPYIRGEFNPNYVTFSASVGGKLYTGNVVLSGGSIVDGKASGNNYNRLGDKIVPGSELLLTAGDKTHAIKLSFDKEVDLSGNNKLATMRKLSDAVANLNEELSDIKIYQQRTLSNLDMTKVEGTVLDGLKKDGIRVAGSDFANDGSFKNISQFRFNAKNNELSVMMDGRKYSQVLSNSVITGGLGERYDTGHKTIRGGVDTTMKLTNSDDDGFLSVNLYGVNNINLSNEKRANDFVKTLNDLFGSHGTDGLSFQVGATLNDTVSVTFQNISPEALYRTSNGDVHSENNILTKDAAIKSFETVENGLEYLKSQIASVGAVTNQFISVDKKLNSVIDSMGDAVSNLMHIAVPDAAAQYASESLKLQAATTAHGYHNTVVKDLVTNVLRG